MRIAKDPSKGSDRLEAREPVHVTKLPYFRHRLIVTGFRCDEKGPSPRILLGLQSLRGLFLPTRLHEEPFVYLSGSRLNSLMKS